MRRGCQASFPNMRSGCSRDQSELWVSADPAAWESALARYWDFVKPKNLQLERELDELNLDTLRGMDDRAWFKFLKEKYFR
jgi:hypothetical protein